MDIMNKLLPTEILWLIFSNLERQQRLSLRLVCKAFRQSLDHEVWTRIWFGQRNQDHPKNGWTIMSSVPEFNEVITLEKAQLVREIAIVRVEDLFVDFTVFTNLQILYVDIADPVLIPLKRILQEIPSTASRHVRYIGGRTNDLFTDQHLTSLDLHIGHSQLPRCLQRIYGTPYLPPVETFAVVSDDAHYGDILAKCLSQCNATKLIMDMPIVNPYGVQWVPDSVVDLTLAKGDTINYPITRLKNVTSLTILEPDKTFQQIQLTKPGKGIDFLCINNTRSRLDRDEDDVEGTYFSNQERQIAEQAVKFLPVTTLHCINLTLSLTARLSETVKRLIIENPKTTADTTFTNFNGMITRLAHHQLSFIPKQCHQLQYLYIDRFFDLVIDDKGLGFLQLVMKKCEQIHTLKFVANVDNPAPQSTPYYHCLEPFFQPPSQIIYTVNIPLFKKTYMLM